MLTSSFTAIEDSARARQFCLEGGGDAPVLSPTPTQAAFLHIRSRILPIGALFVILSAWPVITLAEVRVVTAQGEHRMGDRDTRKDAIRLATEAAKRNALEQVAVYLESITFVEGLDVAKDEIRTYTAGLVVVLEQATNTTLDGNTIVGRTDLVKQVRILVKEHMIDCIRERTGRETEQDIEVTREEIVQEYLQGVKIVDCLIDEEKKVCLATTVILKNQIQPKPAPDRLEPTPTVIR